MSMTRLGQHLDKSESLTGGEEQIKVSIARLEIVLTNESKVYEHVD